MAQYSDLLLTEDSHDLIVTDKDLVVIQNSTEAVKQRLKISLLFFKGEWFLNTEYGIPYYQRIMIKDVSKLQVDALFREKILEVEGVLSLITFTSTFNRVNREYSLSFSCKAFTGETIDLEI
tara:strand:- start:4591 stop:4956 length:366 start_codon:yes stop_codon:yes gene_type:complete